MMRQDASIPAEGDALLQDDLFMDSGKENSLEEEPLLLDQKASLNGEGD